MTLRVLLWIEPRMLAGIVEHQLRDAHGVEVVRSRRPGSDLEECIREASPDVVVCSLRDRELEETSSRFLERCRRRKVVGVAPNGESMVIYGLREHRTAIAELSRDALLTALQPGTGAEE